MSTRTSARTVARHTAQLIARRAVVVAAMLLAVVLAPGQNVLDTSGTAAAPPTRAERLVTTHHCWTGPAPAGVEPAHAVVTLPGKVARVVRAEVGFGIWLDHDPGVLHAFCR
jgi:hypothetical protein